MFSDFFRPLTFEFFTFLIARSKRRLQSNIKIDCSTSKIDLKIVLK